MQSLVVIMLVANVVHRLHAWNFSTFSAIGMGIGCALRVLGFHGDDVRPHTVHAIQQVFYIYGVGGDGY